MADQLEDWNAEILFINGILETYQEYKKLPKFLSDAIEAYYERSATFNKKTAIARLKEQMKF